MSTIMKDIKVMNDPNAVCYMIRCEQSEEETESDLQEIMASIKAGHLTEVLFDEETGDEIPGDKMTAEQLREAAEEYISDSSRDGWAVSWVKVKEPGAGGVVYVADRDAATQFESLQAALLFAGALRTDNDIEIWGMV